MPFAGYKDFEDCVSKNQDKSNPEAYCAVIQKKAESNKDWKVIEYFVPIEINESNKLGTTELSINGIAINETITRNNVKYTAEELNNAVNTLTDKPILKDHRNEVDAIVGRTTKAYFDPKSKAVKFEGKVMDKTMKEMIKDGRIKNVSIGAKVSDLVKEEADGKEYVVAKGIEFLELSLVPVPGDAGATITQALSEAYKIKEEGEYKCEECDMKFDSQKELDSHMNTKHKGEEKMENVSTEQYNALKAELDAIKAEKLKAEEEAKEAERMTKLREEVRKEVLAEISENKSSKGLVESETKEEEKGVLESIGNERYAYWEMPKYKR